MWACDLKKKNYMNMCVPLRDRCAGLSGKLLVWGPRPSVVSMCEPCTRLDFGRCEHGSLLRCNSSLCHQQHCCHVTVYEIVNLCLRKHAINFKKRITVISATKKSSKTVISATKSPKFSPRGSAPHPARAPALDPSKTHFSLYIQFLVHLLGA